MNATQGDDMVKALLLSILMHGAGINSAVGIKEEAEILNSVADQYSLSQSGRKILFTIRRIENGRPGNELGVGSEDPTHPAHRYRDDAAKSVRLQAQWTAGTIRNRWTGDINKFAARWCPNGHEQWAKNANFYMEMK
jgi:hypothetical protein